jgi:PAS domain-containing protein
MENRDESFEGERVDSVLSLILQGLKIAYAITDRELKVVEANGELGLMCSDGRMKFQPGQSLLDLIPELIGNEEVLTELLAGERGSYELSHVNREMAADQVCYLALKIVPVRDRIGRITGLLHLAQDVTDTSSVFQQLVQQRNEEHLWRKL